MDEMVYTSKFIPPSYNPVRLDSIKKRPYQQVPLIKESSEVQQLKLEKAK